MQWWSSSRSSLRYNNEHTVLFGYDKRIWKAYYHEAIEDQQDDEPDGQ